MHSRSQLSVLAIALRLALLSATVIGVGCADDNAASGSRSASGAAGDSAGTEEAEAEEGRVWVDPDEYGFSHDLWFELQNDGLFAQTGTWTYSDQWLKEQHYRYSVLQYLNGLATTP